MLLPRNVRIEAGALALETRSQWQIPNETKLEKIRLALEARRNVYSQKHPNARLRRLSAVYNCIGLVVASRRTWVMPTHLAKVLEHDGFRPLSNREDLDVQDIVIYEDEGEVCHAGFVWSIHTDFSNATRSIQVLSKWGELGEYVHEIDDVPELLGKATKYFTRRESP